jgi:hypothetical protein
MACWSSTLLTNCYGFLQLDTFRNRFRLDGILTKGKAFCKRKFGGLFYQYKERKAENE